MSATIEPVEDREWLARFMAEHWGEPGVVSRGRLTTARDLSGALRSREGEEVTGVVTWRDEGEEWEVVTFDALRPRAGIGTALLHAVAERARAAGARRLWLITTNDNLDALRFYQRRGWRITAVRPGAIAESRKIKPSIPEIGAYSIPIRDEIELEYRL